MAPAASLPPSSHRVLAALALAAAAAGLAHGATAGELTLPAPVGATPCEAVAVRAEITEGPSARLEARISLTVLNPAAEATELELVAGPPASLRGVSRAGAALATADGRTRLRLEAGEVAVLSVQRTIDAAPAPFLDAASAGWMGRARGGLFQPMRHLRVAHPAGSAFAGSALVVGIRLSPAPLASALACSPGTRYAAGEIVWSRSAGSREAFDLAWPAAQNETFVPADAGEAEHFLAYWQGRELGPEELPRVRAALAEAADPLSGGEWAGLLDETGARAALSRLAEAGPRPERAVAAARDRAAGAAARTDQVPAPPASTGARPATAPRIAGRTPPAVAADPLVAQAPDAGWLQEDLLGTTASVPATPGAAVRWVRRGARQGHTLSRAVLARESVSALHGKTWPAGYVATFFGRKAWYSPDPSFSPATLTDDERAAVAILDEWVLALLAERGPEPAPPVRVARTAPPAERARPRPSEEPIRPGGITPAASPSSPSVVPPEAPPTSPPAEGPPRGVPWIRSAAQARLFISQERARGLDPARLEWAIAVVEAHEGHPFDERPALRELFEREPWYRPQPSFGPGHLGIPAREAITLLRSALQAGR